jgi:hypothetical protein
VDSSSLGAAVTWTRNNNSFKLYGFIAQVTVSLKLATMGDDKWFWVDASN